MNDTTNVKESALLQAAKEALRVIALAALPVLIEGIQAGAIDYRLIAVTGIIALLRFLDKYLHESSIPVTGLLGF